MRLGGTVRKTTLGWESYNKAKDNDIPGCVDHVHPPANIIQPDWHDEDKYKPAQVRNFLRRKITAVEHSRKRVQTKSRSSQTIGTN